MKKELKETTKTDIYNLIILDESGSMSGVTQQTINGCNETINTIRTAQKKFEDSQNHYVSIYAFQTMGEQPSRYLIKNAPIAEVQHITPHQYQPYGGTPLLDAIGATLTDLKVVTKGNQYTVGSVTIITDGEENSSKHYSLQKVAAMIEELKELGWNFNFIGANIDVMKAASSLSIDNCMEFEQSAHGTDQMFETERRSRMGWFDRTRKAMASTACSPGCEKMSEEERVKAFRSEMKKSSSRYFEEDYD